MSFSIDQKLAGLSETSNKPFIFRVHQRLRKQNEEAYEPGMISIGPYHYGKESLKKMEKYKLKYLQGILKRREEASAQRYIAALMDKEQEARDCYAEDISLSSHDFLEMMLLDGCFIIEFLRRDKGIVNASEDDDIFKISWYNGTLCSDLLLFENQLPFFILELLFDMTKIENHPDDHLISLSISCFKNCFVADASYEINQPRNKACHLLRLMHESWCSSFPKEKDTQVKGGRQSICIELKKWLPGREYYDPKYMEFIKSVCELKEYGIMFKAKASRSCFDITFENGIMQIPTLAVEDRTECILRNLIVYEQYNTVISGSSLKVVSDYTTLFDCIIDSSKDVQILCDQKIIANWLGSNEEVSDMINNIGSYVCFTEEFCYKELFKDVNKHCSRRRHRWIAGLKIKYFHNPWSIISFLAAIILLMLTLVHTIFTVLGQFKK